MHLGPNQTTLPLCPLSRGRKRWRHVSHFDVFRTKHCPPSENNARTSCTEGVKHLPTKTWSEVTFTGILKATIYTTRRFLVGCCLTQTLSGAAVTSVQQIWQITHIFSLTVYFTDRRLVYFHAQIAANA